MNKKFNIFYVVSGFVFLGLFLWYYVDNLGGDLGTPRLAIEAYLALFLMVVGFNFFEKSKTVTSQVGSLLLRILSYLIFILIIFALVLRFIPLSLLV